MKLKSRPEGIGAGELGGRGRVAQAFPPPELPEPWGPPNPWVSIPSSKIRIKIPTYIIGGLSKFAVFYYPMCNACGSKN